MKIFQAFSEKPNEPLEQLAWLHMYWQEMPNIPQLLCVNSVRTKPPAYVLHKHENVLLYMHLHADKFAPV